MSGPPAGPPAAPPGPPSGPPSEYGYGGLPPYGPPPRPNHKNVIVAIAGVVVVAAAAIIAIVVLSGGDDSKPTAAAPSASPTTAASSPTVAPSSSAPASSGAALTCDDIQNDATFTNKVTLHTGGAAPTDVKLPSSPPALVCTGVASGTPATPLTALAWNNVTLSDYVALLTEQGWRDEPHGAVHVLSNGSSRYTIVAVTVDGNLVSVYGHS